MNRLKELRKEKGLTQQELADKTGTSKLTILKWEKGQHDIKSDKAQQLADFFGVSVAYLLGYETKTLESLIDEVKQLKEYRCLIAGSDIYINEQDVIELLTRKESSALCEKSILAD